MGDFLASHAFLFSSSKPSHSGFCRFWDRLYLTGAGVLAAKYSENGDRLWRKELPGAGIDPVQIAVGRDQNDLYLYLLVEEAGSGQGVGLMQLKKNNGTCLWELPMGGSGEDHAGDLAVARSGQVAVTYSCVGDEVWFDGQRVEVGDAALSCHAVLARVRPNGVVRFVLPLGRNLAEGSSLVTSAIDVDKRGNAWICGQASGKWIFVGEKEETFSDQALVLAVDGSGTLFQARRSTGAGAVCPKAISAPNKDLVVIAGEYTNGSVEFGEVADSLPDAESAVLGFVALAEPRSTQQLVVVGGNPDNPGGFQLIQVESYLAMWGITSYTTVENGLLGTALSVWLEPAQIEELEKNDWLLVEPELAMESNGTEINAGWALARLGDAQAQAPWSYTCPETSNEVVLYLIDTAVANPGSWFDANANLTVEESILIRGTGDPEESSEFGHGTRMLSLIAGPETGAAQGTPIRLVNYDIYPDGATTTATLVAKAVLEAAKRHQQEAAGTPGVICLATSSQSKGSSLTLEMAVDYAVNAGLPVVVSAGNSGEDASSYIPASYGGDDGVVCVGATNAYNQRTAISNFGSAVDLYAPGENVNVIRFDAPASGVYDLSNGTSPATALTAAAALVELSQDPTRLPEKVETLLYHTSYTPAVLSISSLSTTVASDDFASGGFTGGTGWVGSWATSGTVTIKENLMNLAFAGASATRTVDLSAYSSAQLGFHMQTFENGDDTWVVEANDGAGWIIVETIAPSGAGTVVERNEQKIYPLQNHISLTSTVQVRFRITQGYGQTGIQYVSLDDVVITASGGGGGGTTRLVQMGPYGVVIGPPVQTEFEMWAAAQGLAVAEPTADSDGDGTVDLLEFVQGSDPLVEEEPATLITYEPGSDAISYGFEVNPELFDASNPQTLLDGTGWEIQFSGDMVNWHTVSGELTYDSTDDGRVLVTVTVLPETPQCFLRIVLTPAG